MLPEMTLPKIVAPLFLLLGIHKVHKLQGWYFPYAIYITDQPFSRRSRVYSS